MVIYVYRPFAVVVEFATIGVHNDDQAVFFTTSLVPVLTENGLIPEAVSVLSDPLRLLVVFKTKAEADHLASDFAAVLDFLKGGPRAN